MKYIFLFFLITCNYISVFSQRAGIMESPYSMTIDFQAGHYYTFTNTKILGLISVDCDLIYFKTAMGEKRVVLTAKDIKAYVIGNDSFTVIKKIYGPHEQYYDAAFALVISTGKLTLYSHCSHWTNTAPSGAGGFSKSESIAVEAFYYIQKDKVIYRIKRGDFKDKVNFMFGDNVELMNKINQKKMGFNDFEQIIAEYNAWYEKNAAAKASE